MSLTPIIPEPLLNTLSVYLPLVFCGFVFTAIWMAVQWAAMIAWKVIVTIWHAVTEVVINSIIWFLNNVITPIASWVKAVVEPVWDLISTIGQAAWDGLQVLGGWIKDLWTKVIEPTLNFVKDKLEWLKDQIDWFYKEVLKEIAKYWDMTVGKVLEVWDKVKAELLAIADLIGIFKKEWAEWIKDRVKWVNEHIFDPLNEFKRRFDDFVAHVHDWMTDPLDTAISSITWLKDIWDNHIRVLKDLVIPTIEAKNLLAKDTCVTTTITYGEEVANALDGSAWVRPDPPTIVKIERAEGYDVIDYLAAEIMLVESGKFAFAFEFGAKFAAEVLRVEILKAAALTEATLNFFYPGRKSGEKKVQELMED